MDEKERTALAEWAMNHALKSGADQSAVVITNRREIEIECRDRKLEKVKESTRNSLNLKIYTNKRYSSNTTNDLRKDSLAKFITESVAATKYLAEDQFRSLPDPKYYPQKAGNDLKVYDSSYDRITSAERVKTASEIEEAAMAESDKIISTTSWYSDEHFESVRIHSNSFLGQREGTRFNAGAFVSVRDKDSKPGGWSSAETRFCKDLPKTEAIGKNAVNRALQKIGQQKNGSGQFEMIVENRVSGRLIRMLQRPMTGRALQQKNSYLDGILGKKIASEKLTLTDEPTIEKGLGSRWFDGDGIAAKKRVMIEKGTLQHYYIDDYYGKKLGMEPTSGGPSNIIFELGDKSLQELIKNVRNAILVNRFIGGNFNSTTGDFSYGIIGILIENGEITKPVNEMNISGNCKDFWNRLTAMGNDPYLYSSWRTPTMVFEKVHFSGL